MSDIFWICFVDFASWLFKQVSIC